MLVMKASEMEMEMLGVLAGVELNRTGEEGG
jgi:hypothetical protein